MVLKGGSFAACGGALELGRVSEEGGVSSLGTPV